MEASQNASARNVGIESRGFLGPRGTLPCQPRNVDHVLTAARPSFYGSTDGSNALRAWGLSLSHVDYPSARPPYGGAVHDSLIYIPTLVGSISVVVSTVHSLNIVFRYVFLNNEGRYLDTFFVDWKKFDIIFTPWSGLHFNTIYANGASKALTDMKAFEHRPTNTF
ncbi:hypothetical protein BDV26DRAFT_289373 [Aspergillus bertholletiae]|uniref:Uncharacterized protein n=1 Tax=Aspergillus bertholletiae TaxID=1226010 RepID=A0A5N7BIB3_9EURO|nr:hypothetical protein BDV26DRAFT_289373 [Aspergillus bertholletiae]